MLRTLIFATTLALSLPAGSALAETPKAAPTHNADLAHRVEGIYKGNVASDARGSSQNNVTITVTRIGPNKVEIKSSYARIPTVTIPLEKAMDAILAASGSSVFLLDTVRSPDRLDLTIDDASWSGNRVAAPAKK
jgi:hypothetical protein